MCFSFFCSTAECSFTSFYFYNRLVIHVLNFFHMIKQNQLKLVVFHLCIFCLTFSSLTFSTFFIFDFSVFHFFTFSTMTFSTMTFSILLFQLGFFMLIVYIIKLFFSIQNLLNSISKSLSMSVSLTSLSK